MKSLPTRIAVFIDYLNITISEFERSISVSNGLISKAIKGDKSIGSDKLEKIFYSYPQLRPEWLMLGKGEMLKTSKPNVLKDPDARYGTKPLEQIPVVTQDISENTTIPLVDIKAAATYNMGYMQEGYIEELPPFSFPHHLINGGKQYYAFQVMGDSMHPTLYNNDYVVASFIEPNDWMYLKDSYIYVIVTESRGIVIKRLLNRIKEHGFLRARSDNRSHPAFNIEANDILQIWEVKCKISFNMPNENESLYNIVMELRDDVEKLKTERH